MPDDFAFSPPEDVAIAVGEAILRVIAGMPDATRQRVLAALSEPEKPAQTWGVWREVPADRPALRSGWVGMLTGARGPQAFATQAAADSYAERLLTPAAIEMGYRYEVRRLPARTEAA